MLFFVLLILIMLIDETEADTVYFLAEIWNIGLCEVMKHIAHNCYVSIANWL